MAGGFGHFSRVVFADAKRVRLLRSAAALAFFALFALPPILLVLLALAGRIYGEDAARSSLVENVRVQLGKQVGDTVESVVENAERPGTQERIAMLLSYAILLFSATAGFSHLQSVLNDVWESDRRRRRLGWLLHLAKRLFSFVLVVVSSLVLLSAVSYSMVLRAIPERLAALLPGDTGTALLHLYDDLGFLVVGFLGFYL
ncbi:MAG: YhjD/YihY/BrkB family envelope integrity protein, partial [Planctomycetota bacterium]